MVFDKKYKKEIIEDFKIACISREASILGRREVLSGRGKFGIFGAGKEIPQVAMARAYKKGDWRAGYYRDQTLMFALGLLTVEQFFAQLYADVENDPFSRGRQMNNHFATPIIDAKGNWLEQKSLFNTSADISSTGGQMARGLGLAYASKIYRDNEKFKNIPFSENGNEVCFVTIGDASTSEGIFWETLNTAAVTRSPMAISIWDDGYGISVPRKYQTTKGSISKILEGFQLDEAGQGLEIYLEYGWDYPNLRKIYEKEIKKVRETHIPALFHIKEVTQPQGHSTSGSHERYKTKTRLQWEKDKDGIKLMGEWMIAEGITTEQEVEDIKNEAKKYVREKKEKAWNAYIEPVNRQKTQLSGIYKKLMQSGKNAVAEITKEFDRMREPLLHELMQNARRMKFSILHENIEGKSNLNDWITKIEKLAGERYNTHLYCKSEKAAINIPVVYPEFSDNSPLVTGYQILNKFFDIILEKYPEVVAFGEDLGKIGDVNQAFAGMQKKYGIRRVWDTGIREWIIAGGAIGLAMRGLRPIAEVQYLDYLVYGLPALTDDLATLRYRTAGIHKAPVIIRTRGHRLEGIWHSGSPMGMLLNSLRGMYLLVPRNMLQAAGLYNTMLQSDDPAVMIEVLSGYRLRERMPDNIGEFTVPLGVPEIIREGTDITLITYGACVRIAEEGVNLLEKNGISVELIDVQTLLPFDLEHRILESLQKTNKILFMDEDVPGGATAYMMQEVLEKQNGYFYLDAQPATLTAKAHRPPYGSDGDYFSKPNAEDVFEKVISILDVTI